MKLDGGEYWHFFHCFCTSRSFCIVIIENNKIREEINRLRATVGLPIDPPIFDVPRGEPLIKPELVEPPRMSFGAHHVTMRQDPMVGYYTEQAQAPARSVRFVNTNGNSMYVADAEAFIPGHNCSGDKDDASSPEENWK
jgi:hypothetical protein